MSSEVARGAGRMGLATLCSRVLGLVREQVFAFLFGASAAADAFNIAFRIPNLLRDLFAEGAMSAAFVPNFTRALVESRKTAFRLLAGVLSVLVVTVSVLSAIGVLLSSELVALYAGAFREIPGKFELTVGLTQAMFPFFPFVAVAAVLMGALNAMGFFFLPAFAPALFNVASILAGVTLCPLLERYTTVPPIFGMAAGVVAGGFLQFYVQWRQVTREGFSLRQFWTAVTSPLRVAGVRTVLWLLVPGTIGLAATQISILINSIYATNAGPGAVSWLNYAFRLIQFPIGIFGVSLAAAVLPAVSRNLATGEPRAAGRDLNQALRMSFAVNLPATAGLMAIGLPIVQLLFEHGRFTADDSRQTATALFWYALGLPGYSVVKILVPVFYALGTTRVPVISSFVMVALNAALNHLFLEIFGWPFWSLAVATSVSATLNALVLALWLAPRLTGAFDSRVLGMLGVHALVSLSVAAAAAGAAKLVEPLGAGIAVWGLQVVFAMIVAGMLWAGVGRVFGIEENEKAVQFLAKKLRRSR